MEDGINVLSLFDGMSCGRIALERAGIKVNNYYSSEIDKHAIKVADHNWPQDSRYRLGDVTKIKYENGVLYSERGNFNVGKIDLLIGGSPCQSISNLGKNEGLAGKSGLFYHWLRIKEEVNPQHFLLENVVGNKEAISTISNLVGVKPVNINSSLVSAQKRSRLYWTNIVHTAPDDRHILLKDILECGVPQDSILSAGRYNWLIGPSGVKAVEKRYVAIDPAKAACLTARSDASWNSNYVHREGLLTRLTPKEYERLQTVPDNYTNCVSISQRYKMLGNGWTVDVIAHILKEIVNE